jgi:tetratricopeptide (TPR) repeat protein
MKRVMAWMAAAASLSFAMPTLGGQNDPRLPSLFDALSAARSAADAAPIEGQIWALWTSSGESEIDRVMAIGLSAIGAQDYPEALVAFGRIIEKKPDFAEGWNKRATVHYLMGDYQRSTEDIEHVLALEPRHFGALSGLGLIALAIGEPEQALEAFETALMIHPNMAGADTHIRELREMLRGRGI